MYNLRQNWKKWVVIYVLLGALIYAGIYYFVFAKQRTSPYSQPTPTLRPTTTQNETANWKTYTNVKYGYSIKYPQETILEGDENSEVIQLDKQIIISVLTNSLILSCIDPTALPPSHCPKVQSQEEIQISSVNAKKLTGFTGIAKMSFQAVVIPYKNYFYEVQVNELRTDVEQSLDRKPKPISPEKLELFDQILSTFQFID